MPGIRDQIQALPIRHIPFPAKRAHGPARGGPSGETNPWTGALSVIAGHDPVIHSSACRGGQLGCRVTPGNDRSAIRRNEPMHRGCETGSRESGETSPPSCARRSGLREGEHRRAGPAGLVSGSEGRLQHAAAHVEPPGALYQRSMTFGIYSARDGEESASGRLPPTKPALDRVLSPLNSMVSATIEVQASALTALPLYLTLPLGE